jgi:hypothetical protein
MDSYSTASVSGTGNYIGGLVGYALIGNADSSSGNVAVIRSHASGTVTASGSSAMSVGGLVGATSNADI